VAEVSGIKLYLETTVFNYYFDEDRDGHDDTVRLFEAIGRGEFEVFTSDYVTAELEQAPEPKRSNMIALIDEYNITVLPTEAEAERLADLYVDSKIIPSRNLYDATHIGIASFHNLDCILSFNFKHINRSKTKVMTAQINFREGYKSIIILTPEEVLENEETT
jgi:predicted nucleic acid-binding protein